MKSKKKKESFEEIYKKVEKFMLPSGMNKGELIAKLLKKKNNFTFPLYRSALVLTPQKKGQILLEFYHDPAWLGNEVNKKTLKEFKDCQSILLQGQRSGVDVYYNLEKWNSSLKISGFFPDKFIKFAKKQQKDWDKLLKWKT